MLSTHLKTQFRQGLFLIPLILVPLFLFTKSYVIIFFFLQTRFFKVYQQNDFQLPLFYITGSALTEPLKTYNLSWVIWFNLWFFLAQIANYFYFDKTISSALIELLNFNSILFVSFIVGNTISNSDLITLKSSILRFLGSSFVFGISISLSFTILQSLQLLNVSIVVHIFLLLITITTWAYHIKQQKRINFIHYYL